MTSSAPHLCRGVGKLTLDNCMPWITVLGSVDKSELQPACRRRDDA